MNGKIVTSETSQKLSKNILFIILANQHENKDKIVKLNAVKRKGTWNVQILYQSAK